MNWTLQISEAPEVPQCHMGGEPHLGLCDYRTFCHIHYRHEEDLPDDYQACGECYHVFRTEAELITETAKHGVIKTSGEEIYVCPLCAHDF